MCIYTYISICTVCYYPWFPASTGGVGMCPPWIRGDFYNLNTEIFKFISWGYLLSETKSNMTVKSIFSYLIHHFQAIFILHNTIWITHHYIEQWSFFFFISHFYRASLWDCRDICAGTMLDTKQSIMNKSHMVTAFSKKCAIKHPFLKNCKKCSGMHQRFCVKS